MYENLAIVPLLIIILSSCPIISQTYNQTNTSNNLTNISIINNTNSSKNITSDSSLNQTNIESSSKSQQTICLEGLREMVSKVGYPRGSIFYCDCSGTKTQFQCSAVFIDKEVTANINCNQNNICTVKSNIIDRMR